MKRLLSVILLTSSLFVLSCESDSPTGSNSEAEVNPEHDVALYGEWQQILTVTPALVKDTMYFDVHSHNNNIIFSSDSLKATYGSSNEWMASNNVLTYTINSSIEQKYQIANDTLTLWNRGDLSPDEDSQHHVYQKLD